MSRPTETRSFIASPAYLAMGIILALLLFPTKIAYASIIIVAIGDPVAAYIGGKFGRTHVGPNKTLEGLLAGLAVSLVPASILVHPVAAFAGAVGAMLMELLDVPDDNLTMPIAAGALMFLVSLAAH
jgi:dolichol kinase